MSPPKSYRYIFGPVLSRRLGRSLGLDIMPFKTCTYDCVYCEQGRTTLKTSERKNYVPVEALVQEMKDFLETHPAQDFITVSASGEPTLHTGIGQIIDAIKALSSIPVAVITNGSLLWDAKVRAALQHADLVLPSLDAGNAALFEKIDRPAPSISFDQMVDGLIVFRESFINTIWLEVMLINGVNTAEEQLREIAAIARRIRPDRIQLNTIARPPAQSSAKAVPFKQLHAFAKLFEPRAEVIAPFHSGNEQPDSEADELSVLNMIKRRPCPPREIAAALGIHPLELTKLLQHLVDRGLIEEIPHADGVYYSAAGL